ncbi:hypothetical protein [Cohnella faecalis]|uniref:hypothetical protein n=1 Tax=Cohnella faecalis TaxID=2315694 RepID=UPI001313FD00|nr:hypothetical protein [Cohnella faecalis]
MAAIRSRSAQAHSFHNESHLGSKSSFFGGVDPLWTMLAFGMATGSSPFDPWEPEYQREREGASSSCQSGGYGANADGSGYDGTNRYGESGNDGSDSNGSGGDDGGSSSCSSSSCSSSSCSSSCGGGGD